MQKWGIRQLRLGYGSPNRKASPTWLARLKTLGLDYSDYFVGIMDEPGGTTAEALEAVPGCRQGDPRRRSRRCASASIRPKRRSWARSRSWRRIVTSGAPTACTCSRPYFGNPEKKRNLPASAVAVVHHAVPVGQDGPRAGHSHRAVAAGPLRGGRLLRARTTPGATSGTPATSTSTTPRPWARSHLATAPSPPSSGSRSARPAQTAEPGDAGARTSGGEDLRRSDRLRPAASDSRRQRRRADKVARVAPVNVSSAGSIRLRQHGRKFHVGQQGAPFCVGRGGERKDHPRQARGRQRRQGGRALAGTEFDLLCLRNGLEFVVRGLHLRGDGSVRECRRCAQCRNAD